MNTKAVITDEKAEKLDKQYTESLDFLASTFDLDPESEQTKDIAWILSKICNAEHRRTRIICNLVSGLY